MHICTDTHTFILHSAFNTLTTYGREKILNIFFEPQHMLPDLDLVSYKNKIKTSFDILHRNNLINYATFCFTTKTLNAFKSKLLVSSLKSGTINLYLKILNYSFMLQILFCIHLPNYLCVY